MDWAVVKIGAEIFDALHAYGLGVLLAFVTKSSVRLENKGICYRLYSGRRSLPDPDADVLYSLLDLPDGEDFETDHGYPAAEAVQVANMDGLLAALFTTPGVRFVSVADVANKQSRDPRSAERSTAKALRAIERWKSYVQQTSGCSRGWLTEMLCDYDAAHPAVPSPWHKRGRDLSVAMTLDPALSYCARRVIGDGLITSKTNLALRGTQYATLLAFLGAARFLRAQRVNGALVNYYVPLPASVTLYHDTALPPLRWIGHNSRRALALQWLRYAPSSASEGHWYGLSYHIMQVQGIRQSISRDRGCIGYDWLRPLGDRVINSAVKHWIWLLEKRREQLSIETDDLPDCLMGRDVTSWLAHLREKAIYGQREARGEIRPYALEEVKEVTAAMNTSPTELPLSAVLNREQGTLRFGHALRLLGQHTPASLRDIIGALDAVKSRDQLLRLMAEAAQECAVASASTEFIVIPDDDDLKHLLDDIDQYGAKTVAGLLIILSTLRYPKRDGRKTTDHSSDAAQSGSTEKEGEADAFNQ